MKPVERRRVVDELNGMLQGLVGVPDSLLRGVIGELDAKMGDKHIVAPNEGAAVAVAAGWALAGRNATMVYMQNSGIGNAINPLMSLVHLDVYNIPLAMLIGWRGAVDDEPQHLPQGLATESQLAIAGVGIVGVVDDSMNCSQVLTLTHRLFHAAWNDKRRVCLLVKPGVFDWRPDRRSVLGDGLSRSEAIEELLDLLPDSTIIVCTTGYASRQLNDLRQRRKAGGHRDFLVVGSMGHAASIALGIATASVRTPIVCLDGDGALAMHLGAAAMIGNAGPRSLLHVVLNNRRHESVGDLAPSTATADLCALATALGYQSHLAKDRHGLRSALAELLVSPGPSFLEVSTRMDDTAPVGRPGHDLQGRKEAFMKSIQEADTP